MVEEEDERGGEEEEVEEDEEDEEVLTFVNLRYSVSTSALVATRAGQYRNEFILAQTTSPVFSCSTFDMAFFLLYLNLV